MKIASDLEAAVLKYIAHIKADYAGWGERSAIREVMIQEFNSGCVFDIHRKFIKVVTGRAGYGNTSVHSFIMLEDDGKFKRGDILMSASWNAPAKNFARGNVLAGKLDRVTWTGAH